MDINTVKGAILGVVVGDALGVPVEFMSREELTACPVTGMREYGTHDQPAGTWSDDSSMTLCLMESLTHGLDYGDMASTYLCWADDGYWTPHGEVFDMGRATREALVKYAHHVPALECGGDGQWDNGNGSLMRIMPLALYLHETMGPCWNDEMDAYEIIHNASRITHGHPISLISCGIYCSICNEVLRGNNLEMAIYNGSEKAKAIYARRQELAVFLPEFQNITIHTLKELPMGSIRGSGYVLDTLVSSLWCLHARRQELAVFLPEFQNITIHTLKELPMGSIRGSGYVLDTLVSSLWCLLHTNSFRSCVLQAVNLGEDTDTVGAVTGGLAGLYYGLSAIPEEWISALSRRDDIEALCERFHEELN